MTIADAIAAFGVVVMVGKFALTYPAGWARASAILRVALAAFLVGALGYTVAIGRLTEALRVAPPRTQLQILSLLEQLSVPWWIVLASATLLIALELIDNLPGLLGPKAK